MQFPLGTGQLARLLNTTEPKLSEAVRRGKINPAPRVIAGRRLWDPAQVRQAATQLGADPEPLLEAIEREVAR